jgi:hypothetical protein
MRLLLSHAVSRVLVVFSIAVAATAAHAQAPVITVAGDPSISSDTIYKLAVDSTAYPEQGSVILLDDGVVVIQADGRARRTYRQVVQILRERSARVYEEREFTYEPDRQGFTVNWVRVIKPDGTVISAQAAHTQESDLPASMVNPVYVHARSLRMSLSGVAPGTLIDLSYSYDEKAPYRAGDFYEKWFVTAGTTVRRSRFIVDAPKDMKLNIAERNLTFPRREATAGTRKVYTWATQNIAWTKPEMFEPPADSNPLAMSVAVATPAAWSDIGQWYAKLADDRLRSDSRLRDTVTALVQHAVTLDDSIRAIHRWVAQDIRYVALELGIGGYQPRWVDTVMATGFGDCKDKSTLFIAALGAIGIDAYPVLLRAGGPSDRTLPTISAFNHEIAAIKRGQGYEFVDLTSELSPLGTMPFGDAGQFALVVHRDGHTEEVMTPSQPPDSNRIETRLVGTLSPDGVLGGRLTMDATGAAAMGLRSLMRNRMDSAQRETFTRNLAGGTYPGAKGDSLVTFDGKDLSAKPRISLVIRDGQATQRSGATDILALSSGSAKFTELADALEAQAPRKMPIDGAKAAGLFVVIDETRVTMPEGWQARLPPSVTAKSIFGSYESAYRQDGRDLIVRREVSGTGGVFPKETAPALIAWFRAMAADRTSFIVIDHPPAGAAATPPHITQ